MNILIVDDNLTVRKMIKKELYGLDCKMFEAEDGLHALDTLKQVQPDLITIDLDMPKMNGIETIHKIRTEVEHQPSSNYQKTPIIIVTSDDTPESRKKGLEAGANDYIIKPFLRGELAAVVNRFLNPEARFKGLTALVVEDSGLVKTIIQSILQQEGINTLLAEDGEKALDIFKKNERDIDIIITDFLMPKMNGEELCRKIRSDLGYEEIPIIMLSTNTDRGEILKFFQSGASDYVVKPFSREELLARIKVHLKTEILNRKLLGYVHELKRLSKLQNDFLSVTSHDLRSPITGILGFADLLAVDKTLGEKQKEFVGYIKKSGDFLMKLINDILDLGRIQSENQELEIKFLSVSEIVESSINTVQHMATPKEIKLNINNNCPKQPYILGDKQALIRILNNLLSNAIKFTPNQGNIVINIKLLSKTHLSISVTDNGIGIPSQQIPKLFDKFSKSSRPGTSGEKGTGLGLSITKELIELHDGTIEVTSEVNKGTSFIITFPLANPNASFQVHDKDSQQSMCVKSGTEKVNILIADNDHVNITVTKTILEQKGYNVTGVKNGQKALDHLVQSVNKVGNNGETLDLIFMELDIPIMDGFETTQKIRDYEKKYGLKPIPIIALTSRLNENDKIKCREVGMSGFLSKPIQMDQCEKLIHQFIFISAQ